MTMTKQHFNELVKSFKFKELFIEMGWDKSSGKTKQVIDSTEFTLEAIAEKSGFKILLCSPDVNGKIPPYAMRKKLETRIRKMYYEHIIIFNDGKKQNQLWQFTIKEADKPIKVIETSYNINQYPELLYQRISGLFFALDEEDKITIIDVTKRVSANLNQNADKVTKQFYDKFKKEHTKFLGFIQGIDDKINRQWYASLMLNRLMFCYFIQYRGFLDNNKNYLRAKLEECQKLKGTNKFYSFYKNFLLVLFHEGLGQPDHDELIPELGKIPYLNGGLFDQHELEKLYKDEIEIDDAAFKSIFDFFDQYNWHLDTGVASSGRDINPDVIGYIFEKYINDRAEMGAYYTKEDITGYISKNTIIPWLFDEVQRHYTKPFKPEGEIWTKLKASGDAYIYEAVKHGINPDDIWADVPENIADGLDPEQADLVEKRRCWNVSAPQDAALPTEIWREVIERRKRYVEVKTKIEQGEISQINDLITYNLNIKLFTMHLLQETDDPELIRFFYKALNKVTILDPTCGSGAFLFAAMNILEDLYEICIQRMQEFKEENSKGKFTYFEEELAKVNAPVHPNRQYFIYKSIILNNLYGVDIMKEAVEIAKLRLFLKLVACVEIDFKHPNYGLEPLPDIDFNIRCGNTLVGYASEKEIKSHLSTDALASVNKDIIKEQSEVVALAFEEYKHIQLKEQPDFKEFKEAKDELTKRLDELTNALNEVLNRNTSNNDINDWVTQHRPFHWFAEFFEIMDENKGFDIIIGNPPYVEYKINLSEYFLSCEPVSKCGNLYPYIIYRSYSITNPYSRFGMIVPISLPSTPRMELMRYYLINNSGNIWCSNYADRPGCLFNGVHQKLSIILSDKSNIISTGTLQSTRFYHWYNNVPNAIELLMDCLSYTPNIDLEYGWSKSGSSIESDLFNKMNEQKFSLSYYFVGSYSLFLNMRMMYWGKCFTTSMSSKEYKEIFLKSDVIRNVVCCLFNSSLFFWFWELISDVWHITAKEFNYFKINLYAIDNGLVKELSTLCLTLQSDLELNKKFVGTAQTEYEYYHKFSKAILDKADQLISLHYGFTPEELDFIINYDIKYRMGKELEAEE